MNKLKIFFRTYYKTLTEPSYYNHILEAKFSFTIKYFLFFYLLASVITAISFSLHTQPKIDRFSKTTISEITNNYPPEMVLTIDQGQLSVTGVTLPFNIPIPDFLSDPQFSSNYDYLVTIDPSENFPKTKAFLTLTKTEYFIRQPDGSKESHSLSDIRERIIVDKNAVQLATSALQSTLDTLVMLSPLFVFLLSLLFLPLISMIMAAILSLFVWLAMAIANKGLSYTKSFQIGLHIYTFAQTVTLFSDLLFPKFHLSQLFSLAFFGSVAIVIWSLKPLKSTPKPTNKSPLS